MATTIVFAGTTGQRSLSVTVKEDVDQVFKAWREAAGLPFDLTKSESSEAKIWINPLTVAYWHQTWRSAGNRSPSRTSSVISVEPRRRGVHRAGWGWALRRPGSGATIGSDVERGGQLWIRSC